MTYKKGETILRSDDNPQGVYYIKKGFVKMDSIFENGREITLNIFKPGAYFPMTWAVGGILQNIEFILCGDAYHRVLGAVFLSAKRFGEVKGNGKITIKIPLTHQDIANIAGMSRETATLAIKRLRKKKIITYKKRLIFIANIKIFEKELGLTKNQEKLPIVS